MTIRFLWSPLPERGSYNLDMGLKNISQYFLVFIAITTSMMIIQGTLCIHQEKKNRVSLDKCIIFPIFTQNRVLLELLSTHVM